MWSAGIGPGGVMSAAVQLRMRQGVPIRFKPGSPITKQGFEGEIPDATP